MFIEWIIIIAMSLFILGYSIYRLNLKFRNKQKANDGQEIVNPRIIDAEARKAKAERQAIEVEQEVIEIERQITSINERCRIAEQQISDARTQKAEAEQQTAEAEQQAIDIEKQFLDVVEQQKIAEQRVSNAKAQKAKAKQQLAEANKQYEFIEQQAVAETSKPKVKQKAIKAEGQFLNPNHRRKIEKQPIANADKISPDLVREVHQLYAGEDERISSIPTQIWLRLNKLEVSGSTIRSILQQECGTDVAGIDNLRETARIKLEYEDRKTHRKYSAKLNSTLPKSTENEQSSSLDAEEQIGILEDQISDLNDQVFDLYDETSDFDPYELYQDLTDGRYTEKLDLDEEKILSDIRKGKRGVDLDTRLKIILRIEYGMPGDLASGGFVTNSTANGYYRDFFGKYRDGRPVINHCPPKWVYEARRKLKELIENGEYESTESIDDLLNLK